MDLGICFRGICGILVIRLLDWPTAPAPYSQLQKKKRSNELTPQKRWPLSNKQKGKWCEWNVGQCVWKVRVRWGLTGSRAGRVICCQARWCMPTPPRRPVSLTCWSPTASDWSGPNESKSSGAGKIRRRRRRMMRRKGRGEERKAWSQKK